MKRKYILGYILKNKCSKLFLLFILSSGTYQVFAQSITITSPNGGENWEAKSVQLIKWQSENVNKVKLEYSLDNGLSWGIIVLSVDASLGEYSWVTADAKTNPGTRKRYL